MAVHVASDWGPIKILRLSFASCVDTERKPYNSDLTDLPPAPLMEGIIQCFVVELNLFKQLKKKQQIHTDV